MYSLWNRRTLTGGSQWEVTNDETGDCLLSFDNWQEAKDMLDFLNSL